MKSPDELGVKLTRQLQSADLRESRLKGKYRWPICLTIGKPAASQIKNSAVLIREHLKRWRSVKIGSVEWTSVNYQSTASAIEVPFYWLIHSNDEWIAACRDSQVSSQFHILLIRQRSLWKNNVD